VLLCIVQITEAFVPFSFTIINSVCVEFMYYIHVSYGYRLTVVLLLCE